MVKKRSDGLRPDEIKTNLKTSRIGKQVIVFDSTSSTNDIAWEYARNADNDGLVIFAEHQTAGRGRGTNRWYSGRGESILCSVVLLDCPVPAELLVLTCAVTVAEAIGRCGGCEAKIRWPNDVTVRGEKIAGILLESKRRRGCTCFVVGIGVNCHQARRSLPSQISDAATSIDIEGGGVCDRTSLARRLLVSLDDWLQSACQASEVVVQRWCELSTLLGERVTLRYKGRRFTGRCMGVEPRKGLIVQLDHGAVRMFAAAHTTIVRQT
jgi:BirA family biotin operon repressor/biotin-[acetyl-CoA-carboxylase] ligase